MRSLKRTLDLLLGREADGVRKVVRAMAGGEKRGPPRRGAPRRGLWPRRRRTTRRRPPPKRGRSRRERESATRRARPRGRRRGIVAWGISVGLHAAILLVLLSIIIPERAPRPNGTDFPITVRWRERARPPAPEPTPRPEKRPVEGEAEERSEPSDPPPAAPLVAPAKPIPPATAVAEAPPAVRAPSVLGFGGAPPPLPGRITTPPVGSRLEGTAHRRGRGKGDALRRYGGSLGTENAVHRGLRWLADHQDRDGRWSARSFTRHCGDSVPCGGVGSADYDCGVTALAVLAFLGAGHTPTSNSAESRYADVVERALEFLLADQRSSGGIGLRGSTYLYNHAIATLALAEAYELTGTDRYRDALRRAIAYSASTQQGGGWDYTDAASGRNDLSITGWQAMAFAASERAGVPVPDNLRQRLRRYLAHALTPDGIGIYANRGPDANRGGINMVAVGLLSRLVTGVRTEDRGTRRAAERLLVPRNAPDAEKLGRWSDTFQSYYYWYTATLALFLFGAESHPEAWQAWNHFVVRELRATQSGAVHADGSWPPEPSWIGYSGGRVYATAINVLTLETYYRYIPTVKR